MMEPSYPRAEQAATDMGTSDPLQILQLNYKSAVRLPMILNAQTPEARESNHQAIPDGSDRYRYGEIVKFAFPSWSGTGREA
ncbi:MAG: hypothetical protein HKN43_05880 [Rhodothermales bacterium]|nr:hypothetical protein [Rhodothermales bacterium]